MLFYPLCLLFFFFFFFFKQKTAYEMRISDWSSDVCSSDLAIAAGDVTIPDDPAEEKKMLLAIASQPVDTRSTFATGADVSRFQRSTVPAKPQDNDNAEIGRAHV